MPSIIDGRIPVAFAASVPQASREVLLVEGDAPVPAGTIVERFLAEKGRHPVGCVCCRPRSPAAQALSRLYLAYARGEISSISGVLVLTATEAARDSIVAALEADVVLRARFRLAGRPGERPVEIPS